MHRQFWETFKREVQERCQWNKHAQEPGMADTPSKGICSKRNHAVYCLKWTCCTQHSCHSSPPKRISRSHSHSLQIVNIWTESDSYKYSFSPHTIWCWNFILQMTVESQTVETFKQRLGDELRSGRLEVGWAKDGEVRPWMGSCSRQQPIAVFYTTVASTVLEPDLFI